MVDGNQFVGGKEPNMSNVAGVVALIKWGVINPKLGEQGMKDVVLELTKKLEGRKEPKELSLEEIEPLETDTHIETVEDTKQVSAKVKEGLKNKVDKHNEKYGDQKGKRVTQRMLEAVFRRGVGAYNTNPASVRPSVTSQDLSLIHISEPTRPERIGYCGVFV